jgi:hyaluronan synthase
MTKTKRRKILNIIWTILFVNFLILVLLLKIVAFSDLNVINIYTIGITVFMLSRVVGSFFYKNYRHSMNEEQRAKIKEYFPSVTFVIPCKNEEKAIYRTIASCGSSNYPKNKIEIIAINDGSTDNTLQEMQRAKKDFSNIKIRIADFKVNKGKREGMAYGLKNAGGEIVIQVDSDSQPAPDALKEIVIPFLDKKIGATVGHTDPANKDENLITKLQTAYYFMSFRTLKATESIFNMVFCCSGCFSAYRKEYVMPIIDNWLNEKFLGKNIVFGDDRALTNWIIRQGYKTVYVAEAKAITVVPNTLKQFLKQQTRWKKGWLINSIRICPQIIKKDTFVAFTYFIPLIFLTLMTPIIAFKAIVINPLFLGISPLVYILGIMLVSGMLYMQYNIYSEEKYGKYMLLWSILNMTILSYILIYAIYDLRNMAWGTR